MCKLLFHSSLVRLCFAFLLLCCMLPFVHGQDLTSETQEDRKLIIYESELMELMQIISDLEISNNERLIELEQMQQDLLEQKKLLTELTSETSVAIKRIENELLNMELQRNICAIGAGILGISFGVTLIIAIVK